MNDFGSQIARVTSDFISQISILAREAAVGMVNAAMPGGVAYPASARSFPGVLGDAGLSSGRGRRMGRPVGIRSGKRTPDDLARLSESFVGFVGKNPGLRIEQINKQLGSTTKDLALPIRKLVASGEISVKGEKRSTTYFPGRKVKSKDKQI